MGRTHPTESLLSSAGRTRQSKDELNPVLVATCCTEIQKSDTVKISTLVNGVW